MDAGAPGRRLMDILEIDIETYSTVDLPKSNVYAYVEDPAFEVLMCGWSLNDSPVKVVEGERGVIAEVLPMVLDPGVKAVAHNAPFERVCFSRLAGMPVGEYLAPEGWYDTAAVAVEYGYPRKLETLAPLLGAAPKDTAGTALINLFCKPRKVGRGAAAVVRRVMPHEQPEKWAQFLDYCRQDVETLKEVRRRLPGGWPSEFERDLWYADQRVNDRGILVDLEMARGAVAAAEENAAAATREVIEITGVENPGSTQQLGEWCEGVGLAMPDWQADTVAAALGRAEGDVRRVLELRQELALVASRKYTAALRGVSLDGRLRGQFLFHGAHTGRWSSRGVQVHNLPRKAFTREDPETGEEHTDWALIGALILDLRLGLGASPEALKKLVRPMFVSPLAAGLGGDPFGISDFSSIEARILAWWAGEQWVLDAFRAGRDIYVETAQRMGGGMTRADGKIATLALGYQGALGSLRNMGAKGTDAELLRLVKRWRAANPRIVGLWARMETAFRSGGPVGRVRVEVDGSSRYVVLPSGRRMCYRQVAAGARLSYFSVKGFRTETYGGSLVENVTQAMARDLLAEALLKADRAGRRIVAHVHDELVDESPDVEGLRALMLDVPAWTEGLPMGASGEVVGRYTK